MAEVLYTSSDVQKKVIDILSDDKCKRTILVAFVGDGAEEYLSKPKGIDLICWPQPGSTNPKTLLYLIKKGVNVRFCDKLHMKIYSSEKHGTVITSSNLTTNALGTGRLREAGVFLKNHEFNIEKIVRTLSIREPSEKDFEKLFIGYNENISKPGEKPSAEADDFLTWLQNPYREKIKIAVYESSDREYSDSEIRAAQEIGKEEPEDSFGCDKGDFRKGDWLLTIELRNDHLIKNIQWMYVDITFPTNLNEEYNHRALQLRKSKALQPPFRLNSKFKNAVFSVCRGIDSDTLIDQSKKPVSSNVLRRIEKAYTGL